ncbi:serine protease family S01B, partial [Haematococcus lacustris]
WPGAIPCCPRCLHLLHSDRRRHQPGQQWRAADKLRRPGGGRVSVQSSGRGGRLLLPAYRCSTGGGAAIQPVWAHGPCVCGPKAGGGACKQLQQLIPQLAHSKAAVVVQTVKKGSPAEVAGLLAGDIILAVEGTQHLRLAEVVSALRGRVNKATQVRVVRRDAQAEIYSDITLSAERELCLQSPSAASSTARSYSFSHVRLASAHGARVRQGNAAGQPEGAPEYQAQSHRGRGSWW